MLGISQPVTMIVVANQHWPSISCLSPEQLQNLEAYAKRSLHAAYCLHILAQTDDLYLIPNKLPMN
jgi:hypothetical protein